MSRKAELQVAAMVLTRLPCGRVGDALPSLAKCTWAFPVVGVVVGLLAGLAFELAMQLGLPAFASAVLSLAVAALVTGGLHEDGLADTADGFGGGRTMEAKLAIMRDSRIGSFGVLALIFILGITASGIAASGSMIAFVAIGAASRSAMLVPMIWLPPARSEGLGQSAAAQVDGIAVVGFAVAVLLMLLAGQWFGLILIAVLSVAICALARRQIGGQTGDVLGATQKLTECAGWLTAAALAA